jgi:hypothetical protein
VKTNRRGPNLKPSRRVSRNRANCCSNSFASTRDHTFWRCELRDHGEYGCEAHFYAVMNSGTAAPSPHATAIRARSRSRGLNVSGSVLSPTEARRMPDERETLARQWIADAGVPEPRDLEWGSTGQAY